MPLQETKEASSLALLIGITPKYAKEHDNGVMFKDSRKKFSEAVRYIGSMCVTLCYYVT